MKPSLPLEARLLATLLQAARGPALLTCAGLAGAGTALLAGQALSLAAVTPGMAGAAAVGVGLLPAALAVSWPVGVLAGAVAAGQAWAEGGEWLALQASGAGARRLAAGLIAAGLAAAVIEASLTCALEPAGRALVRQTMVAAAGELTLRPGQPAVVGRALLRAEGASGRQLQGIFLASGDVVFAAAAGEVLAGGRLRLRDGTAAGLDRAWTLAFAEASVPLRPAPPRVEAAERSGAELRALAARMESAGKDSSFERMTLYKRFATPASLPLLALLGLPLGVRGVRPAAAALGVTLGWWALMRLCDQAVGALGPALAAALPPLALAAAAAAAWLGWRER